jgi:tetratricopeptide (TPR) repeat protein
MTNGKTRRFRSWALIALGLLCCARAHAAGDADTDLIAPNVAEAERHAAQAYAAYQAKDYAQAAALYKMAFDVAPSADALFNIARVYDLGLRDRPLAMTFYRRYVADAGATPERIKRATQRLAELRAAELAELETRPAETPAASTPVASALPVGSTSSVPAHEMSDAWSGWEIAALTSGAAGTVALGVGIAYGIALQSAADRANRGCDGNACRSQRSVDAAHEAARDARVANWGLGLGLGLLAGATAAWLLDPGAEEAEPASLELAPIAGSAELGASLTGRW